MFGHKYGMDPYTADRYRTVVGPIPELPDVTEWKAAWQREEARGWTTSTGAHAVFRDLDGGTPGNAFVKQMLVLPDALVPADDDRSDYVTVVRRPFEVGYMREYRRLAPLCRATSVQAPSSNFVVMSPPYLGRNHDDAPHPSLTASRNHRTSRVPFFVCWHQAEFPSCPHPRRSSYYVRVPSWWAAVDVPFGAMLEPPPVQTYMSLAVRDRDTFVWDVLRR